MENEDEKATEVSKIVCVKQENNDEANAVASTSRISVPQEKARSSERNKAKKSDSQCVVSDTEMQEETSTQKQNPKRKRDTSRASYASSFESSWSDIDKQRLLIALQRYGVLEIDKLINAVPGKTEDDIRKFINCKWKMARTELRTHLKEVRKSKGENSRFLGPIDSWLEVLSRYYPNYDHYKSNPIAHAVLLIWKYEKHPDPSECGGIDFKALYEHLYCVLTGIPPKHLNQPTAIYLQETLKNFACRIRNGDSSEEMKFLNKPLKINTQTRPPVTEDEVIAALSYTKEQSFDELLKVQGFNPFSVPKELLKKKVPTCTEGTNPVTGIKTYAAKKPTTSSASRTK